VRERVAPGHDLGAAIRQQIDLGEILEDAHGVVGAEHGDGAGEADALGLYCRRGEHDGGRGDEEVGAVVLADAKYVEPELVGKLDLLHQLLHPLAGADAAGQIGECREPELHHAGAPTA
jgi:hypothetical protein